jgi:hypothetical protein
MQKMLATTEAYFQLKRRNIGLEQLREVRRWRNRQIDPMDTQPAFEGNRLLWPDGLAVPAAEESFGRAARAIFVVLRRQAATASLSALARSVFSQEKDPSRPALRPK